MSRYIAAYEPGHPLASVSGHVSEHRLVLFNKIGFGPHLCHWCGTAVHWKVTLLADHVDEVKTNNEPENIVPACRSCNQWRNRKKEGKKAYICDRCGDTFSRYKSHRRNTNTYCSPKCYFGARYNHQQVSAAAEIQTTSPTLRKDI